MDKKELMKQVILQNNRDRQKKASDQWVEQRRRASDLSFAPGDEDDQVRLETFNNTDS